MKLWKREETKGDETNESEKFVSFRQNVDSR